MLCRRDPDGPRTAREWVADQFGDDLDILVLEAVQLIVSELVTNAIVHAHGEVEVCITTPPGAVRIEVIDQTPDRAPEIRPLDGVFAANGRGLRMVEGFSRSWGVRAGDHSKVVWAEVRNS
ncbi:MAG TPA: ATP-binding protein [Acidimicrobiia bacterium]|nr:ATP-binding protein [Acidimicrobiia bacterium]